MGGCLLDRRAASRLVKQLDEERKAAVEQLKQVAYFHRQVVWLQERFPKAELEGVPGAGKASRQARRLKLLTGNDCLSATWAWRHRRRTRILISRRRCAISTPSWLTLTRKR